MRRISLLLAVFVLAGGLAIAPRHLASKSATSPDFVHFESPHVHPVAMTPDQARLLVVNTPDGYLTTYSLTADTVPTLQREIAVGLEPVSVRALNDSIAWVVNFLSDDVNVVNLNLGHTIATLRVGDEPGDVVFANGKAYVSVGGQDVVKVYDPATLALLSTITIPGRTPRALATNPAGTRVYVANFMAGNRTSILGPSKIPSGGMPEDPELPMDPGLPAAPAQGLIVQQLGSTWYDMYGNNWNSKVPYSMPDNDISEINTATDAIARNFTGQGTTIFAIDVCPANGRIVAPVTEGRNLNRFELRVSGYQVETNLATVSFASGTGVPVKLDAHIDYFTLPGTQAEADSAIGIPTGIAAGSDTRRVYVSSFATNKIAVCDPLAGALSAVKARVACVAGPTGVLVDEGRNHLYVVGRFHNQLQTLKLDTFQQAALTKVGNDPTPDEIVNGRKFFYGGFTSTHGDQSCATCHLFGDLDGLAWDLGDPYGSFVPPTPPNTQGLAGFHPMKGPMVTQTLRGLTNTEPLHWRGDRVDLSAFNAAFMSLMGRSAPLADSEMTAFGAFVMPLTHAPNPNQHLNRQFPDAPPGQPSALRGREFFVDSLSFGGTRTCESCHAEANFGPGTNRQMVHRDTIFEPQDLKVPQLRNLYRKTGFRDEPGAQNKRGFGYTHDGSSDTPFRFLHRPQFAFGPDSIAADEKRRDMEAYLLAFDTGMSPAVGFQMTFDGSNNLDPTMLTRMDTLESQAQLDYCDVVARGRVGGQPRSWYYNGPDSWKPDKAAEAPLTSVQLRALAGPGSELTLLGVPKGSGQRMGNDRDRDTYLDGDERDHGSDPGDFLSIPSLVDVGTPPRPGAPSFALRSIAPNPFRASTEIAFTLGRAGTVDARIYDLFGREVKPLAAGRAFPVGPSSLRWDGRDRDGRTVPAGVYFVRMKTEAGTTTRSLVRLW